MKHHHRHHHQSLPTIPEWLPSAKAEKKHPLHHSSPTFTLAQVVALVAAGASIAAILTSLVAACILSHQYDEVVANAVILSSSSSSHSRDLISLKEKRLSSRNAFKGSSVTSRPVNTNGVKKFKSQKHEKWPKVAWLMSFPNSGTSYTIHLTRESSNTTTATNYALEGEIKDMPSIPIRKGLKNGPFLELIPDMETKVPDKYILTKTHCSGFCSDCNRFLETPRSFQIACQSGRRAHYNATGQIEVEPVTYDLSLVGKVVHLVRHPLDNVVARFHLIYNRHKRNENVEWLQNHSYNSTGFRRWCAHQDAKSKLGKERWVDAKLAGLLEAVPCHQDFFRWCQWHNFAFALTRDMNLPTLVVHYKDYRDNLSMTLDRLLSFLELSEKGRVEPFYAGKEYLDHYSLSERRAVYELMKEFATAKTWQHVRGYNFGLKQEVVLQ